MLAIPGACGYALRAANLTRDQRHEGYEMRALMVVHQPCILCEETIQIWTLFRDDETKEQKIVTEDLPHNCEQMRKLRKERVKRTRA